MLLHFFIIVDNANERHEFVSDTLRTDKEVLAEVEEGMKKLTMGTRGKGEFTWYWYVSFNSYFLLTFLNLDFVSEVDVIPFSFFHLKMSYFVIFSAIERDVFYFSPIKTIKFWYLNAAFDTIVIGWSYNLQCHSLESKVHSCWMN